MPATAKKQAPTDDHDTIYKNFKDAVNMTPAALEKWLDSDDSKSVGWVDAGESEAVGHKSGKKIIDILATKKADLTEAQFKHMQKVVSYVHRHMAQGPEHKADIKDSRWRYSLMNWGHDPLKA